MEIVPDTYIFHSHHKSVATKFNSEQKDIYGKLLVKPEPIKRKVVKNKK